MESLYDRYGEFELSSLEERVTLPYVLKDKLLISPGVYKGIKLTEDVIRRMYKNTKFNDESSSLFYDHLDMSRGGGARTWIGEVKNIKLKDGGVYGDLYIVNKQAAIDLEYGAKFGISAKIAGRTRLTPRGREFVDGVFENWSLVWRPADKNTYLNCDAGDWVTIINFEEVKMPEENNTQSDTIEFATKKDLDALDEKLSKIVSVLEDVVEKTQQEKETETKDEVAPEKTDVKETSDKEEDVEAKEKDEKKELSADELKVLFESDEAREFVKKYLDDNPTHGLLEAADAWDKHGKEVVVNNKIDSLKKEIEELHLKLEPERNAVKEGDGSTPSLEEVVQTLSDEEVDKAFLEYVMLPASKKF